MEIIAAIFISTAVAVIVMGILGGNAVQREADSVRNECEAVLEEEREKCNRYRETLDGFIERHNALKEELAEKNKEVAKLKYQLKTAESVINAIDNELSGNTSYSKERLPENICTNTFFCEDYRLLNVKGTHQYLLQQECFTEEETGLRYYSDGEYRYYCVALGNAYGIDIGDAWNVTLENGEEFRIIYADYKHSIDEIDPFDFGDAYDSDGNQLYNYDENPVINVLEFVIDTDIAPRAMILAGTVSYYERFGGLYGNGGNITEMKYIERKWER